MKYLSYEEAQQKVQILIKEGKMKNNSLSLAINSYKKYVKENPDCGLPLNPDKIY